MRPIRQNNVMEAVNQPAIFSLYIQSKSAGRLVGWFPCFVFTSSSSLEIQSVVEKVTVGPGAVRQTKVPPSVESAKKCRIVPTTDFAEKKSRSQSGTSRQARYARDRDEEAGIGR